MAERYAPNVLTVAMLAERWGTSATFVYDLIRAGRLPAFRLGGKLLRIRPDDVEEFECRDNPGLSDRSPGDAPTDLPIDTSASSGLTPMDRTASRLARQIEQPRRLRLVSSGPGGRSPPPAPSERS